MKIKSKGIAFIVGAVAGGVVGSITALLFAPKSGKELRGDIKESAEKVIEAGSEVVDQVSETVYEASKRLEESAAKTIQQAKQGMQSVVSSVKQRCSAEEAGQSIGEDEKLANQSEAFQADTDLQAGTAQQLIGASELDQVNDSEVSSNQLS